MRITTIGDSFTYGQNVNTEKNWSEILEVMLNQKRLCGLAGFEVINLGMPGFDIEDLVRRYERIGNKYQPDLIIWFDSGSGFVRFNESMQPLVKKCLGEESENLDFEKEENLHKLEVCYDSATEQFLINHSLAKRSEMIKGYFKRFFELPHTNNTIFYYYDFYYEERGYDYQTVIKDWQSSFPQAKFFADLPFKPHEKKYKLIDGHPNVQGHQQIAQTIYNHLISNGLFCKNNE